MRSSAASSVASYLAAMPQQLTARALLLALSWLALSWRRLRAAAPQFSSLELQRKAVLRRHKQRAALLLGYGCEGSRDEVKAHRCPDL